MFFVRGMPILVDEVEILNTIKQQVYEQQGREILRKIKRSGNNIMVCCPVHNEGQERRPSCGILTTQVKDKPAGTYNCFACHSAGSFEMFVAQCFQSNDPSFGAKWLMDNFVTGETYERPDLNIDFSRDTKKKENITFVTEEELSKYRYYHPYMWKRKLTKEIVEKYDIGYQKDYVFSEDWKPTEVITFPVRDKNGNCLFVARRSIYGKTFFLPQNIEKPIYGIYELPKNCNNVVICESVFNALTCVAYGRPALAMFGTGDSNQYEVLNNLPIRHYTLGLDPDKAGTSGTYKLKRALKGKLLTKLVIPTGKDINDLSYQEFIVLPEIFI